MQHTTTRDECYYRSPTEPGVNSRGPLVSHVETLCGRTGAVRININNEQRRHSVRRYYLCEARLIWPRGTTTTPRAVRVFLADPGVRLAGGPCTECRQRRQPALRHLRCQLPCGYQHSRRPARRHHRRRPYGRSTALPLAASPHRIGDSLHLREHLFLSEQPGHGSGLAVHHHHRARRHLHHGATRRPQQQSPNTPVSAGPDDDELRGLSRIEDFFGR